MKKSRFTDVSTGAASVASGADSAHFVVTPQAAGSCTITVTGGDARSTSVPVTVTAGPIVVTPGQVTFTALGAGNVKKVTVTQLNFTGSFTEADDCSGVATLKAKSNAAGSAVYEIAPVSGGACTATFTGAEGLTGNVTIGVNVPGKVSVSPTALSFSQVGPGYGQSVTVTQPGYSGAFTYGGCSGIASVRPPSGAKGVATYTVTPTYTGPKSTVGCTVTFTGGSGHKATLSISVIKAAKTGPFSFTYSYAAGGELEQQQFIMAADSHVGTMPIVYGYTPAGRLTQRIDDSGVTSSCGGAMTTTYAYDGYGRLVKRTFPCGNAEAALEYDPSGDLLGHEVVPAGTLPAGRAQTFSYDALGELTQEADAAGSSTMYYANGIQVWSEKSSAACGAFSAGSLTGASIAWDARMGAAIGSVLSCTANGVTSHVANGASFDAVGRSELSTDVSQIAKPPSGGVSGVSTTQVEVARSYDVENHVITTTGTATAAGGAVTMGYGRYTWGVNGHPIRVGSGAPGQTGDDVVFWDGGAPVYTLREGASADVLDDVKLGALAELAPVDPGYTGVTFYDRGNDGSLLYAHNATGAIGAGPSNPWISGTGVQWAPGVGDSGAFACQVEWQGAFSGTPYVKVPGAPCLGQPSVGLGGTIGMLRTDGFEDGMNTIQGARAYDPTTAQWTTPDAFAGTVDDPASQKSYMWNGNNPVAYSDPTGYDTMSIGYSIAFLTLLDNVIPIIAWHAFGVLKDDSGKVIHIYSFGPSTPIGGFLDNRYDVPQTRDDIAHGASLVQVAACRGTCSWEAPISAFYNGWQNGRVRYGYVRYNSNSGLYSTFAAGGLGSSSAPGAPGWVPGWGQNLSASAQSGSGMSGFSFAGALPNGDLAQEGGNSTASCGLACTSQAAAADAFANSGQEMAQ